MFKITCLYCDTIDQVKMKILDRLYTIGPYSTRGHVDDYELRYNDPGTLDTDKRSRVMQNIDATRYEPRDKTAVEPLGIILMG